MTGGRRRRGLAAVLLAAPLALAAPAGARPLQPGPQRELDQAWAALGEAKRGWSPLLTPAFPTAWPPGGGTGTRRYAFAYSLSASLADGSRLAGPWAMVEVLPGAPARVSPLAQALVPLGLQGVRPMSGEEVSLAGREGEAGDLLTHPPDAAESALIRGVYCAWTRRAGLAANALAPRHPAFFAWLGCD